MIVSAVPDLIQGDGIGQDLIRVIRKIHQVERRLADLEHELTTIRATDVWLLKEKVDGARTSGQDQLQAMAHYLRQQIAALREEAAL